MKFFLFVPYGLIILVVKESSQEFQKKATKLIVFFNFCLAASTLCELEEYYKR